PPLTVGHEHRDERPHVEERPADAAAVDGQADREHLSVALDRLHREHRGDHDQQEPDHGGPGHPARLARRSEPVCAAGLGHAVRALVADGSGDHAGGADRLAAPGAVDPGRLVPVPVAVLDLPLHRGVPAHGVAHGTRSSARDPARPMDSARRRRSGWRPTDAACFDASGGASRRAGVAIPENRSSAMASNGDPNGSSTGTSFVSPAIPKQTMPCSPADSAIRRVLTLFTSDVGVIASAPTTTASAGHDAMASSSSITMASVDAESAAAIRTPSPPGSDAMHTTDAGRRTRTTSVTMDEYEIVSRRSGRAGAATWTARRSRWSRSLKARTPAEGSTAPSTSAPSRQSG